LLHPFVQTRRAAALHPGLKIQLSGTPEEESGCNVGRGGGCAADVSSTHKSTEDVPDISRTYEDCRTAVFPSANRDESAAPSRSVNRIQVTRMTRPPKDAKSRELPFDASSMRTAHRQRRRNALAVHSCRGSPCGHLETSRAPSSVER
jgi:hypothetical protein